MTESLLALGSLLLTSHSENQTSMTFDFKIRFLGYYMKPGQNMKEEEQFPEEAAALAPLLQKSFDSLQREAIHSETFLEALDGNAVFIFRDQKKNLYAYFPIKGIARLTAVKYSKSNICVAPPELKEWFIPGETWHVSIKHSLIHVQLSDGSWRSYSKRNSTITTDWDGTHITLSDLPSTEGTILLPKKMENNPEMLPIVLRHRWFYAKMDGDISSDWALSLCLNTNVALDDIKQAHSILDDCSDNIDSLSEDDADMLGCYYKGCTYCLSYLDIPVPPEIGELASRYSAATSIRNAFRKVSRPGSTVDVIENGVTYSFRKFNIRMNEVTAVDSSYILIINGPDLVTKKIVNRTYWLSDSSPANLEELYYDVRFGRATKISLQQRENRWVVTEG